jgi:hypothetical protein
MKIFYCDTCGVRIPAGEIAVEFPDNPKYFCSKHRPQASVVPVPSGAHSTPVSPTLQSKSKITPVSRGSDSRIEPRRSTPSGSAAAQNSQNAYIWGGAAVVLFAVMILFFLSGDKTPERGSQRRDVVVQNTEPARDRPRPETQPTPPSDNSGPRRMGPSFIDTTAPSVPSVSRTPAPLPSPAVIDTAPPPPVEPAQSVEIAKTTEPPAPEVSKSIKGDAANLLVDPGFESGKFGAWDNYENAQIVREPANARTGSCCGKLSGHRDCALRQVVKGLKPSTRYTLTGWIKGANVLLGAKEFGPPDEVSRESSKSEYQLLTVTFTTGPKATSVRIFIRQQGNATVFADDVCLKEASSASEAPEKIEPAKSDPAVTEELPEQKFDTLQENVFALLEKNDVAAASAMVEQAKSDATLKQLDTLLQSAGECVRAFEEFAKASIEGIDKIKEQRAFTLKRKSGREHTLGTSTKASVAEVKDGSLIVEVKDGGMVASETIALSDLTDQTRFELAELALPRGAETNYKLAFAEFILFRTGLMGSVADIRSRLDWARKDAAVASRANFVQRALETYLFNQRLNTAMKKVEASIKDGNLTQAHTLFDAFKKEFGTSPSPRTSKFIADKHNIIDVQPGLWTSYYSGTDDKTVFKKFHFARAESKINFDVGEGSPDPRVPVDYFGIKYDGVLRIAKAGDYTFSAVVDDVVELKIDGQLVLTAHWVADHKPVEKKIALTAGEHEIHVQFIEFTSAANLKLLWKLEGDFDYQEIPAAVLWHKPEAEQSQKPDSK